jgi:hypothetical protein
LFVVFILVYCIRMYKYVIRMCFLELPAKDQRMTHFQHSFLSTLVLSTLVLPLILAHQRPDLVAH